MPGFAHSVTRSTHFGWSRLIRVHVLSGQKPSTQSALVDYLINDDAHEIGWDLDLSQSSGPIGFSVSQVGVGRIETHFILAPSQIEVLYSNDYEQTQHTLKLPNGNQASGIRSGLIRRNSTEGNLMFSRKPFSLTSSTTKHRHDLNNSSSHLIREIHYGQS